MGKRGALKILAFLCGLYFILDFALPAKLGGDFDGYAVDSPAPATTSDGTAIFYVGRYDQARSAVGRLAYSGGQWRRGPDKPVIQRSLFVSDDQAGMEQLDVLAGNSGLEMLHIGINRDQVGTLCRAEGDPSGVSWQKKDPVRFGTDPDSAPEPTLEHRNGKLPGELKFFAAARVGDQWQMLLVLSQTGKGLQVWRASGKDWSDLRLDKEPLLTSKSFEGLKGPNGWDIPDPLAALTAFDARPIPGGWQMYFASDYTTHTTGNLPVNKISSLERRENGTIVPVAVARHLQTASKVTAMRVTPDGKSLALSTSRKLNPPPPPEYSTKETQLVLLPLQDGAAEAAATDEALAKAEVATNIAVARGTAAILGATVPGPAEAVEIAMAIAGGEAVAAAPANVAAAAAEAAETAATAGEVIKTIGAKPTPTYVSRGIQWANTVLQVIGSFAVFIAMINLVMYHGKRVIRKQKPAYSLVFFVFLLGMFLFSLMAKTGGTASGAGSWAGWQVGFDFLFNNIVQPMTTAVFSMITFFMISAAYRSFRVRSLEAAMLMIAACLVMIGQMPIGQWLGAGLPESLYMFRMTWVSQKLLTVINACASQGVTIGLMVGGLSITLRIWLGLDNSVYSGLEEKR